MATDPTRPLPPVPPDLDLSGFPWMPLDTAIVNSDLVERAPDAALKAALVLWCLAWKNVPASSLPGDEKRIAALIGVSPQKWKVVREWAMAGFVMCADGRFYHSMIAEQALACSAKRQRQKDRAISYWAKQKAGPQLALACAEPVSNLLETEAGGISKSRGLGPGSSGSEAFELPAWIERGAWDGFVAMRKLLKAPLTPGAMKRTVEDLEKLRDAGHDPNASLRQSEQKSWRGVFEPRGDAAPTGAGRSAASNAAIAAFVAKGQRG